MSQSLHPMLNIAITAARAAGAIINRGSRELDLLTVKHKGLNDFASEVDEAAESVIIETVLGAYPGHGILAEESGRTHGSKDSEFTWIIDPLDGTTNFLHGFPVYCVSIALAHRGVVQQAVVYDPTRNDLFYASRGRGAFLNDSRLRVSKRIRLADALIGTGFPFRKGDSFQRYMKLFETVMQSCAGVRRPGAAALDLCYVAAGWYDGFFETGLNAWDVAAGSLIITEAGGLVGNFTGDSDFLHQREVVAGSPKIYGQLVTLLAPHTRVIKADETPAPGSLAAAVAVASSDAVLDALAASLAGEATAPPDRALADAPADAPAQAPARVRKPVRIRKIEAPAGEPAPTREGFRSPDRRDARSPQRDFQRDGQRGHDRGPGGPGHGPARPSTRGPIKPRPKGQGTGD
ncbi:MAG: inositol monophosphatase [Ideonella sp.]|nr:inositol monophosphatase [Ideonella sp.]